MTAKMFLSLTVLVLSGLCLPVTVFADGTCDDVDSQACQVFTDKKSDLCSDSCLAKLCPRLCGNCPLKCYGCKSVGTPEMCNNTIICPDQDHYCVDSQTFTNDFRLEYNLGCAHRDVCNTVFSGGQQGKRQIVKGECCQSDLCNHHIPGAGSATITIQFVTVQVPSMDNSSSPSSSACSDLSSMGCQMMVAANKTLCNEPCFVSTCPRTCGKCAECYSCNQVSNVDDCNSTTTCLAGEECYVVETFDTSGNHGFRMGCMHQDACTRFHAQAGQIFGKRGDSFQISFKGDCCTGDLCNHKQLGPSPTNNSPCTYGGVGHHCPTGYFLIDGKCYHIGDKSMTYAESQAYCKSKCGMLTEHLSSKDSTAVLYYLSYLYHKSSVRNLYIGAVDKTGKGYYTWDTTGGSVFTDTTNHGNYCVTISIGSRGHYTETNCNSLHQPLCMAAKQ